MASLSRRASIFFDVFLINCWSSAVASVVLPQFCAKLHSHLLGEHTLSRLGEACACPGESNSQPVFSSTFDAYPHQPGHCDVKDTTQEKKNALEIRVKNRPKLTQKRRGVECPQRREVWKDSVSYNKFCHLLAYVLFCVPAHCCLFILFCSGGGVYCVVLKRQIKNGFCQVLLFFCVVATSIANNLLLSRYCVCVNCLFAFLVFVFFFFSSLFFATLFFENL